MKAVLIDDDLLFCRYFSSQLQVWGEELGMLLSIDLMDSVQDVNALSTAYDVYFIDIEMPGESGLELVKKLRQMYAKAEFVIVSAHDSYLTEAFFYKPSAFIRKNSLEIDTKKVLEYLRRTECYRISRLSMEGKGGVFDIRPYELVYCKSMEHYVNFIYQDGTEETYRTKLDLVEKRLRDEYFVRIHSRYLVNLRYVAKFQGNTVLMDIDGLQLPVSRASKKKTEAVLMNWFRSKTHPDDTREHKYLPK